MSTFHRPSARATRWLAAALAVAAPAAASAQDGSRRSDIEIPVLILEPTAGEEGGEEDADIDLANIVQTAAKGVTTVQEAPAIVTIITGEELRDRGFRTIDEAIDLVPGWTRDGSQYNQFPTTLARGTFQALLFMHDGISLFDPMNNVSTMGRQVPIETIKRIELVTGPGGVLWGANSYMGIVNVIRKDAEDVNGVEAAVALGDGNGDRGMFRGYVMAGVPELLSDDIKLMIHGSFETYIGPGLESPAKQFSLPLPQPNGQLLYGPFTRSEQKRSLLFSFDGKAGIGPVDVYFQVPFVQRYQGMGFPGNVLLEDLREDANPLCPEVPPFLENGQPNPDAADPQDPCVDQGRLSRESNVDWFDRYLMAEYRTRFADGKAGVSLRAYGVQFNRNFDHLQVLAAIPVLLEGGLAFHANMTAFRAGGSIDGDLELPGNIRLLYGGEAFREWVPDNTERSRQGPGVESYFFGPIDLGRLPLPCPWEPDGEGGVRRIGRCPLTMVFETSRVVLGAFVDPQWRPSKKLILDAGVRAQVAPESLGNTGALAGAGGSDKNVGYPTQIVLSSALVYNFIPDWHLKLNYAEGFRPPVINNISSNGEAVELDGGDLDVETSQAGQVEVNARLFKGERRIRELNFRADYSYTRLENLIQIVGGRYENTADRGIHSAELLGKLYLQGGHRVELSYTWLKTQMEDKGAMRAMPEHWFSVAGVYNLVPGKIEATTTLKVLGAFEDPNRMVEYRDHAYDMNGHVINAVTGAEELVVVQVHDLTLDRVPPAAELMAGVSYTGVSRLRLTANAYNLFNARHFQPDPFHDYEPRLEFVPNMYEDFRFTLSATYSY